MFVLLPYDTGDYQLILAMLYPRRLGIEDVKSLICTAIVKVWVSLSTYLNVQLGSRGPLFEIIQLCICTIAL